jgi:hypothetical protein
MMERQIPSSEVLPNKVEILKLIRFMWQKNKNKKIPCKTIAGSTSTTYYC